MSHIFFTCPECDGQLKLPADLAKPGDMISCPVCNKPVRVPKKVSAAQSELPTVMRGKAVKKDTDKPAGKHMFFECPQCKNQLKLPLDFATPGDNVVCPKCGKHIRVPPDAVEQPPPLPTVVKKKLEPAPDAGEKPAVTTQARPKKKLPRGKLILAAVALAVAVAGPLVGRMLIVKRCRQKIECLAAFASSWAEVSYGDMEISPLARKVSLRDVILKPSGAPRVITVSNLVLDRFSLRRGIPRRLVIEAQGLHIPLYPETFGKAGPAMKDLEYYCIHARGTCRYTFDRTEKKLTVEKLQITSPGVGDMELSLTLSDIDLDAPGLSLKQLLDGFPSWQIHEGNFDYRDDSFIARFLSYQADYIGETPRELHEGMLIDIDKVIQEEKDTVLRDALVEFRKFIVSSQYLGIRATPGEAVSVSEMLDSYDERGITGIMAKLKVRFSVNGQGVTRPRTQWEP